MSSSINCSSRKAAFLVIAVCLLLTGCSGRERLHPPLELRAFSADRQSPQPVHTSTIHWHAEATGGAGNLSYRFMTAMGGREFVEQEGAEPTWEWAPKKTGVYRTRVVVTDTAGQEVDSGWSSDYLIVPPVDENTLLAMLPIENLSGGLAPLDKIAEKLKEALTDRGVALLRDEELERFMRRYRIRHTGGIDQHAARAIKEETGAEAVLITSLEAYQESDPPKISLVARLVLSGETPGVLWMDSVGMTGIDSHGLLGLSRIKDGDVLLEKASRSLVSSLLDYLSKGGSPETLTAAGNKNFEEKYKPKRFYRGTNFDPDRRYKIAVVPFLNLSERKDAGAIITLHFVEGLHHSLPFAVLEPGLVRGELLKFRRVMKAGPSLADAELICSKSSLDADLVLTGRVYDFQSVTGIPKVDFSVQVIDSGSRELLWESRSYNHGEEGVYFFDFGRVHAAQELSSEMTRAVLSLLVR